MNDSSKFIPYLNAGQKTMIKRLEWSKMGFTEEDIRKLERNFFNDIISNEISQSLDELKKLQGKIEEDSKKSSIYFYLTTIVAIGGILISIALRF